jgi:tripartite-type tricarboxylate transporter receptor subunit TctC
MPRDESCANGIERGKMSFSTRKSGVAGLLAASLMAALFVAGAARADDASFKGKQVKIVVGYGAGGSYDTYARLLSRYLPKYLAGNPPVVVQNMTGAGGLSAANYLYSVAPKDGTVLGVISQTIPIDQALGEIGASVIDTGKFNWIGRLANGVETIIVAKQSGVATVEDAKKREVVVGATGPSAGASVYPTLLNNVVGTKFKLIRGYAGTREMMLAMERGEVAGLGAMNVATLTSEFPDLLRDSKINVLVQISVHKHPLLPNVPTIVDLGKTDEDKKVLSVFAVAGDIGRSIIAPPDMSPALVKQLRGAFDAALKDPELLAAAEQAKLEISPLEGVELQKIVEGVSQTPKAIVDKAILFKRPQK